jgi:sec-independent protein translocase protein TatA
MLEGWEWIVIGGVAIVIIMWGPAKIPEFARAIGRAKGEFNKASKEFEDAATVTTVSAPTAPSAQPIKPLKSRDEILIETARTLGISTDGLTREQIAQEISNKANALGSQ